MEPFVQKQFDEYQANRTEKEILSKEELRDIIIKDLSFVSTMGVAEYTLYQKYQEIHLKYPSQTIPKNPPSTYVEGKSVPQQISTLTVAPDP